MTFPRIATLAMIGLVALALPADAASKRRQGAAKADDGNAAVERLNEESLQRARAGQGSPSTGADTTSNLNNMSQESAGRGQNMNQAPMPFR